MPTISQPKTFAKISVIDSHTDGEPTRVVVAGGPDLKASDVEVFRRQHDLLRSAVVHEPRGFDALVGALLLEPSSPDAVAGMIFFNNADTLHMCGHGTIGVAATLQHMGRIGPGRHRLESPVGDVEVELHDDGSVSVDNVFSYRYRKDVEVALEDGSSVRGEIAWGGNWFFLVAADQHGEELSASNLPRLLELTSSIRRALDAAGITGENGGLIDHIELCGPPSSPDADGKNFVLCPGGEYDRCPCGTGTSAKMACLAAEGKLEEGGVWRQEGVLGTIFEGRVRRFEQDGVVGVLPRIRGRAWITAESTLLLDATDPLRHGIRKD